MNICKMTGNSSWNSYGTVQTGKQSNRPFNQNAAPDISSCLDYFSILWIPFAIVKFGITHEAVGFVVFAGTVFPIVISTYLGFKKVPTVYVETAEVPVCTKNIDFKHFIVVPTALHSIAAGIRIALEIGLMCLVAAEYLMGGVSVNGFGYQIWHNYYLHRTDYIFAYILLLGFVGLFVDHFFRSYADAKMFMACP